MPLVDENGTVGFQPVFIWSIGSQRHQNNGMRATESKIHPLLEARALAQHISKYDMISLAIYL